MLEETDDEALDHLLDLKNQVANLRLMLEAELAEKRERAEVTEGIEAWLQALRERLMEAEEETEEAYQVRRLLVAGITVGRREDRRADVRVTYRFGEPPEDLGFVSEDEKAKAFQVAMSGGESHTFDSFERAVHALAPTCEYCNVKVIGHGVEADSRFFCCAHCASMAGVGGVADRA